MGGFSGTVRGKSKIEAYLNYVREVEKRRGTFNSHKPHAKKKKVCKSLMVQNPESGEWILHYHFHT